MLLQRPRRWLQSLDWHGSILNLSPAAIMLGSALNILEAVSIGLLLFPPSKGQDAFSGLQSQAMSLYIMSTVTSQAALTLGGSQFPCALGSMLAEVLPFLRSIASGIQNELGANHPGVLPTTMATYAMTSLLLGAVFAALALLRCSRVIGYFPETVMTGVIGGVGVSLFRLGLEITFPHSLHFNFQTLFSSGHLPKLAASVAPAGFLSISTRLESVLGRKQKVTQHALYIPAFCVTVGIVFWIVVAICGRTDTKRLAVEGWLFAVDAQREQPQKAYSWNYWALFDFTLVEWQAMTAVLSHVALLVVVGALSLPVLAPLVAEEVAQQLFRERKENPTSLLNMVFEFLAHALSNFASGIVGTVPNMVVYSNTRFFARASGHRPDALIVMLVTFSFMFFSSHVLPYIPTILASVLILFIGIELIIDALWTSEKCQMWYEWIVVLGTTIGCSVFGFVPGIGVGLMIVIVLQFWHHISESRPRLVVPCLLASDNSKAVEVTDVPPTLPRVSVSVQPLSKELGAYPGTPKEALVAPFEAGRYRRMQPPIIHLAGHAGFVVIPTVEKYIARMEALCANTPQCIIIDMSAVRFLEPCTVRFIAKLISRLAAQTTPGLLVIVKPTQSPQALTSLLSGGLNLRPLEGALHADPYPESTAKAPVLCDNLVQAIRIFQTQSRDDLSTSSAVLRPLALHHEEPLDAEVNSLIDKLLCRLAGTLSDSGSSKELQLSPSDLMKRAGLTIREVRRGEAISCSQYAVRHVFMVLRGRVVVKAPHEEKAHAESLQPIRIALRSGVRIAIHRLQSWLSGIFGASHRPAELPVLKYLQDFDWFDGPKQASFCAYASGAPCWILDVDPDSDVGVAAAARVAQHYTATRP